MVKSRAPRSRAPRRHRAKRAPRKRAAKKANNLDIMSKTIHMSSSVTPSQGSTVSNYIYWCSGVTPYKTSGDGYAVALASSTEFALYKQLYDQFRVHSVTCTVKPVYDAVEGSALTTLQSGASPSVSVGKNVFYSVIDRDGIAPSSIQSLKKYSSIRVHKADKPMSRTYTVKYDGPNSWFDCQKPENMDQVQTNLGLDGGITFYGESLLEKYGAVANNTWADLEITYRVSFRGKATLSLTVDAESGAVTVSQAPTGTLEAIQVIKSNDEVDHYGSIDLSGNRIE